jgi:type II secretory pathway pseudopilin PulG
VGGHRPEVGAATFREDRDERGFGLLELVVACGVMLSALTSMAYVATNSFYDIAAGKERQAADGLLDEAIEELRALDYNRLYQDGVRTSDLVGDPRVLGAGTVASPYLLATTGHRLINVTSPTSIAPLTPNLSNRTIDGVVFAIRVYPTYFDNDPRTGAVTVTAYVDWTTNVGRGRATFVRAITTIFSPSAQAVTTGGVSPCVLKIVHPFSGPCPAAFTASVIARAGSINTSGSGTAGTSLSRATNDFAAASSTMSLGQVRSILGIGNGGGVRFTNTPAGYPTSNTRADNDPSTPFGPYDSKTVASAGAVSASGSIGLGTFTVAGTAGTGKSESVSAIAATATDVCKDTAGTTQTDGLSCGRALGRQAGAMTSVYDLTGIGLGSALLSEATAPPADTIAFTKHIQSAASGPCTGTSAAGCVRASATRSLGRIRTGGLPSVALPPAGFLGYLLELSGYSDSVSVEAGIGAADATKNAVGSLRFWSGGGYTTVALSGGASLSITTPLLSVTSGIYTISVSATVRTGTSYSSAPLTTCDGALACRPQADATIGTPLAGTVTYRISTVVLGEIFQLTASIDLGDVTASATYTDPR